MVVSRPTLLVRSAMSVFLWSSCPSLLSSATVLIFRVVRKAEIAASPVRDPRRPVFFSDRRSLIAMFDWLCSCTIKVFLLLL